MADEFDRAAGEEDVEDYDEGFEGEGTLVSIGKGADEEEVEDLINVMQNALDKSETGVFFVSKFRCFLLNHLQHLLYFLCS